MPPLTEKFAPFAERMKAENLPDIAIRTFKHYYAHLLDGQTGLIAESDIKPITSLPDANSLPDSLAEIGRAALPKTIILKLNGGLGTSMGLAQAKSLLPVKNGQSFLDIIAQQAKKAQVPLVLMDSFATQADTLTALAKHQPLPGNLPLDFLQHKVPKIRQSDLSPATYPADPEQTWCPPGHGDIYTALVTSGILEKMLADGYEYAFVSNADNLGAVLNPAILGYFVAEKLPFMMEVAARTPADKKGGHLAQRPDGRLILRESAQCPAADMATFQDIERHKYFNTNNLWIHLPALKALLEEKDYVLGLPMIRNSKTVNPRDPESTPVYQLETAMGSAIGVFAQAQAIRVPRTRFAPVKKTNDLLLVRSDVYQLTDEHLVVQNPALNGPLPSIELDTDYYKFVGQLDEHFPAGPPSLLKCRSLKVEGPVIFGADVRLEGDVRVINRQETAVKVADGRVLKGAVQIS